MMLNLGINPTDHELQQSFANYAKNKSIDIVIYDIDYSKDNYDYQIFNMFLLNRSSFNTKIIRLEDAGRTSNMRVIIYKDDKILDMLSHIQKIREEYNLCISDLSEKEIKDILEKIDYILDYTFQTNQTNKDFDMKEYLYNYLFDMQKQYNIIFDSEIKHYFYNQLNKLLNRA
ncbi:MAG TPA: hypothetical protein GX708_16910 [Gallicola sp.]|nr:hypothetical protein [Gallicola sp.]